MTHEEATALAYRLVAHIMARLSAPAVERGPSAWELVAWLAEIADLDRQELLRKYGDPCVALECWKPAPGEVHPCIEAGCAVDGDTEERWGHWVMHARGDALGGV